MAIHTPDWVKNAVFYQIFPDRFARSNRVPQVAGLNLKPWGAPPEDQGFQGGDLLGIVDRLDYLQNLGVNALYLNPIFASASNHRYHTFDYYQVDPLLGGNDALRELLDEAHRRDIRVVLDGVFNHASRGFWAFHHILENGGNSPYIDWFTVRGWPMRPYSSDDDNPPNYDCWWNLPALPKFNIKTPAVRQYLLEVARYWIDFGIDGWRLDVPQEIKDVEFWREFRRVVKQGNPEAYICGEIWHLAPEWLQGDRFDALMNYPFGEATLNFFAAETLPQNYRSSSFRLRSFTVSAFAERIEEIYASYNREVNLAQMNLFDSHDTARLNWMVGGDPDALRQCVLFQMTMPGAPCIYYGSEIGMSGGHEPGSRGAMPWSDEAQWDVELLDFYRRAVALRHRYPALRTGGYHLLYAREEVIAFARRLDNQEVVVVFNRDRKAAELDLPVESSGHRYSVLFGADAATLISGDGMLQGLSIPAKGALVFLKE